MNSKLNFVADFIKIYCKVLITIYIWSIFDFLRPNLELSSVLLPESTKHKSILLMIVGTFIFTTFGYCFKLLVAYIIIFIIFVRLTIFIENFGLFDPLIDDNTSFLGLILIYIPMSFIDNVFRKEINFFIKINNLIDRISQVTHTISKFVTHKENELIETITKKYTVKTSESPSIKQGREIKSVFIDICITLIGFPVLLALCWMIVGILLFLFVEYLNIWKLFFPPFFLLLCTYITAIQFSD